jgi:hypothetical protein
MYKIVEIRSRRCQWVLWDSQLVFSMVCWRLYGVLLEQYIQEIINHCDKLHDYEKLLSQWLLISHIYCCRRTPHGFQHTTGKVSYKLAVPQTSLTISTSNLNNLIQFNFLSFHPFTNLFNAQKRTAEVVTILCKKWDLISGKSNLYILFKNVLMLTWRLPREVKTRSYIILLKFCCVWWSFVYSFFIVPCTTECITLK